MDWCQQEFSCPSNCSKRKRHGKHSCVAHGRDMGGASICDSLRGQWFGLRLLFQIRMLPLEIDDAGLEEKLGNVFKL